MTLPFAWNKNEWHILDWPIIIIFFFFLRAAPTAHRGSQARGWIGAYTRATATWDWSCFCNPHHSSQQCQILNPLSKARDQTRNLMAPGRIPFCCATTGTPWLLIFKHHKIQGIWSNCIDQNLLLLSKVLLSCFLSNYSRQCHL